MRISINADDRGYLLWGLLNAAGRRCEVFLDGMRQEHCITADEAEGIVMRYAENASGNLRLCGDDLVLETVRGEVLITITR